MKNTMTLYSLLKTLLILALLQLILSSCTKKNIGVVLEIPGNYPVQNKLVLAQGLANDIKSPAFLKEIRNNFPTASQKSIDGIEVKVKDPDLLPKGGKDVVLEIRIQFWSGSLKTIQPAFEYVIKKIKNEIEFRTRHIGVEFLIAQDTPETGLKGAIYNNPPNIVYVNAEPVITNADIEMAHPVKTSAHSGVEIVLNDSGMAKINVITLGNIGKRLAVAVNGQVLCAPRISEPVTGPRLQIAENPTEELARKLSDIINNGLVR